VLQISEVNDSKAALREKERSFLATAIDQRTMQGTALNRTALDRAVEIAANCTPCIRASPSAIR
jgi:hypothetical protein